MRTDRNMKNPEKTTDAPQNPGRRSLLVAGAWAAPVILTAVAVPMAAASGELEIEALSGSVSGRAISFSDVSPDDTVPLVFQVTVGGSGYTGTATAALVGAAGNAEWDPGVTTGGTTATGEILDGELALPITILGTGSFTVVVSIGNQSWDFTVSLTGA